MADTAQVTYTHSEGNSIDFFTNNVKIDWLMDNKKVEFKNNKVGISVDSNRCMRQVSCSAILTSANLNTLNGYLRPASAATYDGTYPNVKVYRDGTNSYTILCMVTQCSATMTADSQWLVSITFTERST